jgi:hypothetical protein
MVHSYAEEPTCTTSSDDNDGHSEPDGAIPEQAPPSSSSFEGASAEGGTNAATAAEVLTVKTNLADDEKQGPLEDGDAVSTPMTIPCVELDGEGEDAASSGLEHAAEGKFFRRHACA